MKILNKVTVYAMICSPQYLKRTLVREIAKALLIVIASDSFIFHWFTKCWREQYDIQQ